METLSEEIRNEVMEPPYLAVNKVKEFIKNIKEDLKKAGLTNCSLELIDKRAGGALI